MEKISAITKGDKAILKVLLKPVYELGNKIVCEYQSEGNSKEFSFYSDNLIDAPEEGKKILVKELVVEDVLGDSVICKIEGGHQQVTFHKDDLEILEGIGKTFTLG